MKIGETLRQAREKAGLSIEDVRNTTQIMVQQLVAMESNDFSSFSAPVYAKGFLRLFARAVGLDPAPLVAEFEADVNIGGKHEMPSGATSAPHEQNQSGAATPPKHEAAAPSPDADQAPSQPAGEGPAADSKDAPPPAVAEGAEKSESAAGAEPDLFSLAASGSPTAPTAPVAGEAGAEAPTEKIVASAQPSSPAAPSGVLPAHSCVKRAVSTPLPFERKTPPKPLPEKRIAPPEPGAPPQVPPLKVREVVLTQPHPVVTPPAPISKPAPVPHSALSPDAKNVERAQLPDPLPQDGAFFAFPEYTATAAFLDDSDDDSDEVTPPAKKNSPSAAKATALGAKAAFSKIRVGLSTAGSYSRRRTASLFRQIALLRGFGGGKALAAVAAVAVLLAAAGVFSTLAGRRDANDGDQGFVEEQEVADDPEPQPETAAATSPEVPARGPSTAPVAPPPATATDAPAQTAAAPDPAEQAATAIDPRYAELTPILPPPASFAN